MKYKTEELKSFYKNIRKIHMVLGPAIILIGCIHGYFMLGGVFMFHDGLFIMIILILLMITGILRNKGNKLMAKVHGFLFFPLFIAIVNHVLF